MKSMARISLLAAVLVLAGGCQISRQAGPGQAGRSETAPVHLVGEGGFVRQWLVIGPFPNPQADVPTTEGASRVGYDRDYLAALGGEASAVLTPDTRVTFEDENGVTQKATARLIEAYDDGVVDLDIPLGRPDHVVGYAFAWIESDRDQTLYALFGSDDSAKVWVNGQLVYAEYILEGRAVTPGEEIFPVALRKGRNAIMVKVEEWVGGWALTLEIADAQKAEAMRNKQQQKRLLADFRNLEVHAKTWQGLFFEPGALPPVGWEFPYLAEQFLGTSEIRVRWFSADGNQVTRADKPGRYAAVIDAAGRNGLHVRRAITCYCRPKSYRQWENPPDANVSFPPNAPIDPATIDRYREQIASELGGHLLHSLAAEPGGPAIFAWLTELAASGQPGDPMNTPGIADAEYHLSLKRKLLGRPVGDSPLKMPQVIQGQPATVLHAGTLAEAGVKPDAAQRIRAVCQAWYDASKEPCAVLVARHGVIVIHEAFGEMSDGPATVDTPMEMASITKSITGLMFAQFVDQGLVAMDDPVGKFLPDFPTEGDNVLTLRHCLTHTSGLTGHYEWGGIHNPWLDNVIANGLEHIEPGTWWNYNGVGFDLAGKVMEVVSGKSIFRLMRENFFVPLGVEDTTIDNLACCTQSIVEDIARMGQLLLNRGGYGNRRFFSPETFEQMMPRDLSEFYPGVKMEYGMGLAWTRDSHPDAGKDGNPEDMTILSRNVIGHGAASSAIFRVDLDNDLVIVMNRNDAGADYDKHVREFFLTIADVLGE